MNKYVIYTIMVGGYDDIIQPGIIDNRFDYILFSNDFEKEYVGVWKVQNIPNVIKNDNKRLSRYPKTHPESLLSEYDFSLYIDANIQINNQWVYDRFVELAEKDVEFAGVKLVLTGRDCIYRHAYDICVRRIAHDYETIVQMNELYKRRFPEHFGLNENNIIFRKHTEKMAQADEEWWWWITHYSFRDQFSYMYCLWKYEIKINFFLPIGLDARNNSYFVYKGHDSNDKVSSIKFLKQGTFERLRSVCRCVSSEKNEQYCEKWVELCKTRNPRFSLFVWGVRALISDMPSLIKKTIDRIKS